MKFPSALIACALMAISAASAQVLTNFGVTASSSGSWVYTPATSTLSGTEGIGDVIFGTPVSMNISGATGIRLTANATTAPSGFFTVTLEDGSGNLAVSQFTWSSFTGGATLESPLSYTTFDLNDLVGWSIDSGGSLQSIDVSFSQMTAVPEPNLTVLLAPILALLVLIRRHRINAEPARAKARARRVDRAID